MNPKEGHLVRSLAWFGRLPGDIRIEGDRVRIYLPLTSLLILSAVLSAILFVISRFRAGGP